MEALVEIAAADTRLHEIRGNRLGLDEDARVALVFVREGHREPIGGEENQPSRCQHGLAATPQNSAQVEELQSGFDIHRFIPNLTRPRSGRRGS